MASPKGKTDEWTEGRIRSFITSVLRAGSRRWPPKYTTLKESYRETKINEASGRMAKHYECNKCKKLFPSKDVQIDHIKPIVSPAKGFTSWDDFIAALFCPKKNLQTLCKGCHLKKSKEESAKRKSSKSR